MQQPPTFPFVQAPRLAVLIDAENARAAHMDTVMAHVHQLGRATVRRAYGDWTTPQLQPWKPLLETHAILPCQQFRPIKGKNTSDIALVMDAMELLHEQRADGICLVSSDSDYTGLARRAKESNLLFYGFGQRHTHRAFVAACDAFVFLDEEAAG